VVGKSQGGHLDVGNLCGGGIDGVGYRRGRGGDGRGGSLGSLCEPALDLADDVVKDGNLLRDGERRQGEKHGRGAHVVLCVSWSARMCRRDCDELLDGGRTPGARVQMTQSFEGAILPVSIELCVGCTSKPMTLTVMKKGDRNTSRSRV
jgi:hypothetical protein